MSRQIEYDLELYIYIISCFNVPYAIISWVLLNIYLYLYLQTSFVVLSTEQDVVVWMNYVNVWSKLIVFRHYILAYF